MIGVAIVCILWLIVLIGSIIPGTELGYKAGVVKS